jgi:hypothetical protein
MSVHAVNGNSNPVPSSMCGPEILAGAKKADLGRLVTSGLEQWFGRVLKESLQPANGNWGASQWLMVPDLRWGADCVLGYCASRDPRVARIEFQTYVANRFRLVSLTIVSNELIPNRREACWANC